MVISPDTRACGYFVAVWGLTVADKTYSASALAQMACRLGFSPLYLRLPRFFRDLAVAKGDGRYGRLLRSLAKTELVVLDDWGWRRAYTITLKGESMRKRLPKSNRSRPPKTGH